ncbi:MAG: hypothetical protein AB8H47_20765 [Bacteroidia bacterium]
MSEIGNIEWGTSIPNSPAFPEYIVGKEGKPKKKKATPKKMIIADPGLAIEVEFSNQNGGEAEEVKNLKLIFDLYVVAPDSPAPSGENAPTHSVEFGVHNGDAILQVPATYKFVVPFADKDWLEETGHGTTEVAKDFYYRLQFQVVEGDHPDNEWIKGDIVEFPADYIKPLHKFNFSPTSNETHSEGNVTYSSIVSNAVGVAWKETYHKKASYTSIRDIQTTKESFFLAFTGSGGTHPDLDEQAVCVLPTPIFEDANAVVDILRTNFGSENWDVNIEALLSQDNITIEIEEIPEP